MEDTSEKALLTFQAWDSDGDGFISKAELSFVLSDIGVSSEICIEDVFHAADLDRDGMLNYSEFLGWIFSEDAPESIRFGATVTAASLTGSAERDEDREEIVHSSGTSGVSTHITWETDVSPWPLNKLRAALRVSSTRPKKGFAVLITTGAMNPVHRGHVQQLHQARERLEVCGYRVVAAWLSPSHDGYVQPKCLSLRTIGLSAPFRLALARHAVEEDDFVAVAAWEASKEGAWPDFPVVLKALQDELRRHRDCRGIQLFYVCGDDHFKKCGLHTGMRSGIGVVTVPRGGLGPVRRENMDKGVFVARAADGEVAGYSSTKVRDALCRKDIDYVRQAISPGAARFLLEPSFAEYAEFRADYIKIGVDGPSET